MKRWTVLDWSILSACVCAAMCGAAGCGQPAYPYQQPQIRVTKTIFGAEAVVSTDAGLTLEDLEIDPSTGVVKLKRGSLDTKASPVLDKFLPLMQAYAVQQQQYANIRAVEWQGVNQLAGTLASVAGPALGQYFSVKQAQAQVSTGGVLRAAIEVAGKFAEGTANPAMVMPQLKAAAPDVAAEVERIMPPPAPGTGPAG